MISMIRIYLQLAKSSNVSNDSRALHHKIYCARKKNVHGKFRILSLEGNT